MGHLSRSKACMYLCVGGVVAGALAMTRNLKPIISIQEPHSTYVLLATCGQNPKVRLAFWEPVPGPWKKRKTPPDVRRKRSPPCPMPRGLCSLHPLKGLQLVSHAHFPGRLCTHPKPRSGPPASFRAPLDLSVSYALRLIVPQHIILISLNMYPSTFTCLSLKTRQEPKMTQG